MNIMASREIVFRSPEDLSPHPNNPRTHSPDQKEQLRSSVSRFGWVSPLVVDEDLTILAGHGRWEMAVDNHMEEVPTLQVLGLTDEEKRAYIIADNRLSENADWDIPMLMSELEWLSGHAIESDTLGFSDADILGFHSQVDDTGFSDPEQSTSNHGGRAPRIESTTEPTQLQPDDSPYVRQTDTLGGPSADVAETLVPFSLMLPLEDRERVFAVLNHVRGEGNMSLAEALMVVVDSFDAQSDDADAEE